MSPIFKYLSIRLEYDVKVSAQSLSSLRAFLALSCDCSRGLLLRAAYLHPPLLSAAGTLAPVSAMPSVSQIETGGERWLQRPTASPAP